METVENISSQQLHLNKLEESLDKLYRELVFAEKFARNTSESIHPNYQLSARNLIRYLILRSHDLRNLHDDLTCLGITSIRSSESYVLSNVTNALKLVKMLQKKQWQPSLNTMSNGYKQSKKIINKHVNDLFLSKYNSNFTSIMVTMPTEAGTNVNLIKDLAKSGMQIARINLSHDDMDVWKKMINNINKVNSELTTSIRIYMDLEGPKIRVSDIRIKDKKKKIKRNFINIRAGEKLTLTEKKTKGREATYKSKNKQKKKSKIGITVNNFIPSLKKGERVFFDDGMIEAKVIKVKEDQAGLLITNAYKKKLRTGKGLNFPDSKIRMAPISKKDLSLLPFILENADFVGYSFLRTPKDVKLLYNEIDKYEKSKIGVILKIENQEAFENLPLILLEAMKRDRIGVMIARGDLAVEVGFDRIPEVQKEILWLCEAAHIPVIWATQVLDRLAKSGMATRAEVTDAATAAQADCVMLNKGPEIVAATQFLHNLLHKMEAHSFKNKNTLRKLNVAKKSMQKFSYSMN